MCVERALPTGKLGAFISSMGFSLFIPNKPPSWVPILLLLLLLCHASSSHKFSKYGHGISEDGSTRKLFESRAIHQPNNCGESVVQSQCSHNSKCSWCTSEVLDDMCFTKSEAWRLPHQVYSCALIR